MHIVGIVKLLGVLHFSFWGDLPVAWVGLQSGGIHLVMQFTHLVWLCVFHSMIACPSCLRVILGSVCPGGGACC